MNITLLPEYINAETSTMLQAFYSRNHKPIKVRLEEMGDNAESVKKNLEKWYVGYGHKSIGQCGSFTLFIENVSILAAKAIQDTQLYNGIETSTRYIDFSTKEMYEPFGKYHQIQQNWLDFYTENQDKVLAHVVKTFDIDVNDKIQYKTAKARTFDILRGFLPAGCMTQLSWHTTFDHASDRLIQLVHHPLEEVRIIANEIIDLCIKEYPYAFSGIRKQIERFSEYYTNNSIELNYHNPDESWIGSYHRLNQCFFPVEFSYMGLPTSPEDWFYSNDGLGVFDRPKWTSLPRHTSTFGRFYIDYLIDYGSFRDIQRHRSCDQLLPILTTQYGFHDWYLDSLPKDVRKQAEILIDNQLDLIAAIEIDFDDNVSDRDIQLQYLIPLGFKVGCNMVADLKSLVYISEIRTGKTVHPTLREIAKEFAREVSRYVPVYDDQSEDDLDLRRGTQDIVEK